MGASAQLAVAATAVGCLALLVAEWRQSKVGQWIAKPLASAGFVATAWLAGALQSGYGRLILAGLALGWLGDVLLIPKAKLAFLLGIGTFLLGHVIYVVAFFVTEVEVRWLGISLGVLIPIALLIGRWLLGHVEGGFRVPVIAYIAVITLMVAAAAGTRRPLVIGGAIAFYFSDLSVARDRFVRPGFKNRLWGLPLYYGAQVMLALTC